MKIFDLVLSRVVVYSVLLFFCILCWGIVIEFVPWLISNWWKVTAIFN